ncbi:reverse transcriptase domain-containing protein, partial [Tanacetum coccineum]
MDPYEEVAQQGQAPLSPAYVPDPTELDEHVPVYVLEPEHPKYHVPSDDDMQVKDQPYDDDALPIAKSPGYITNSESMEENSIDYPDEPEDDDKDPKEDDNKDPEEDPSEEHEHEDDDEAPSEENEPEDEDTREEEPSEGSDKTEPFKEDETAVTPPPPPRHRGARISVRPQTPMAASTQALIDAFAAGSPPFPLPSTSPVYDQAPLGHRAAMIRMRDDILEEDMPPQRRFETLDGQYDFVDIVEVGQGLIPSPGHNARTIARAADRAKDVGYVRALQASEHRMMTSIEEVNLRDAQTNRRDIRLEIDVVRGQRTAYEIELRERQSAEDFAVRQMMVPRMMQATIRVEDLEGLCNLHVYVPTLILNFKGTEGVVRLSQWLEKLESVFHISGCAIDNQVKFAACTLLELALICTKFLADETEKVDKYISGLPDNIHGNVMSVNTKNNNNNQKAGACYECGNTGHIKKNCPKLKNRGNGNGNGTTQGRAYALGGRDASPDSNVIT